MSLSVRLLIPIATIVGLWMIVLALPLSAHAQTGQPAGTRLATPEDLPLMRAAGIPNPTVGMAWDPNSAFVGTSIGTVKLYLMSLPRTGSAALSTNIESLNSAFATCSSNFLKEYQKNYGTVTITSAYRSVADEVKLCVNNPACGANMNNPNPTSLHSKGFAMDVKAAVQTNLIEFARKNPQFGVCFPFTGEGGGFKDQVHMILAGISSNETRGPGCVGVTKACDSGLFSPSMMTVSNTATQFPATTWQQQPAYQPAYPMVYQPQNLSMLPPPPPPVYQPQPMLPTSIIPSVGTPLPTSNSYTSNTGSYTGTNYTPAPPAISPSPIYATSTTSIPAAALIIAQSATVARNASTLIAWTSVGMVPTSCSISANGTPFGTGAQGSKLLGLPMTAQAGTIAVLFDCTDVSGTNHKRSVNISIE